MAIDSTSTNPTSDPTTPPDDLNAPLPQFDNSLPDVPQYHPPGTAYPPANPYGGGTPQSNYYDTYVTALGRAPEAGIVDQRVAGTNFPGQTEAQQIQGIWNSPEATTFGRARNEVNPLINSQEQGIYDQLLSERLKAQSDIGALQPLYEGQLQENQFGLHQGQSAIDAARARILEDQVIGAQRYQNQINPAILAAREAANRTGLLNSSVAIDRVNNNLQPITQGLSNLALTTQRGVQGEEAKRADLIQKYLFQRQHLVSAREQAAGTIRSRLAQLIQAAQAKQAEVEAGRNPQIAAKAGGYFDTNRTYGLQQEQLQSTIDYNKQQRDEYFANLAEQQRQFNKLHP